jgi:hypothetical protein
LRRSQFYGKRGGVRNFATFENTSRSNNQLRDAKDPAYARVEPCKAMQNRLARFSSKNTDRRRAVFFEKIIHGYAWRNFFSKIFLRISERNEYAFRQPSVSAIRFEVRVYKKSKNLNDAAFVPNG